MGERRFAGMTQMSYNSTCNRSMLHWANRGVASTIGANEYHSRQLSVIVRRKPRLFSLCPRLTVGDAIIGITGAVCVPRGDAMFQFEPVEIQLTQGYIALVDRIDADLASLNWCVMKSRRTLYAQRRPQNRSILMHRIILERILERPLKSNEIVDHIDHNGLNNKRDNLRLSTYAENQQNRKTQQNNTSGFKGVYAYIYNNRVCKWIAQIRVCGKLLYLGRFTEPEFAAIAYNEAALKYFGQFAELNEIPRKDLVPNQETNGK